MPDSRAVETYDEHPAPSQVALLTTEEANGGCKKSGKRARELDAAIEESEAFLSLCTLVPACEK